MRDLNVATLLGDIVEGVPVVYSTFVGYDEVAHHSGIEQPDAFAVLKQHDAQLARLERAIEQAPRPYHLVVLSDHGQSQGRPFRQRYGVELEELVREALSRRRGLRAARPPDEGLSSLGGALTDARDEETAGAQDARPGDPRTASSTARSCSGRTARPSRSRGGTPRATRPIVLASGGLGLISLPERDDRLSHRRDRVAAPALISTLVDHPGIGFVMVRADGDGRRRAGRRRQPASRRRPGRRARTRCATSGPTPPTTCGARTAFPHCPDILVNCIYDAEANEVAPFEEFMGSHGGLGGWQMRPFALVPAFWSEPESPIVGRAGYAR